MPANKETVIFRPAPHCVFCKAVKVIFGLNEFELCSRVQFGKSQLVARGSVICHWSLSV